jgi:hypothetical protein
MIVVVIFSFGRKIGKMETLLLQDAKPLFHLIHPGAVNRGKMNL